VKKASSSVSRLTGGKPTAKSQLRRVVAHEHGGERGAEAAARAGVEVHQPLLDDLIRSREH
jgi:hypothetical protein